ncbi:hypothetical protein QVN85_04930 [Oscillibacter valericigenes]|nr:hypothetical protein [Oscillibacter valericigenes]
MAMSAIERLARVDTSVADKKIKERTGTQNAPSSSAPMVGLGRRKTPEEIIAQNRIAAQKTGAPVLGEGFNRRVIAKSSRGEQKGHTLTKQSALGGGAVRGRVSTSEPPTFLGRMVDTVSGAGKSYAGQMVSAGSGALGGLELLNMGASNQNGSGAKVIQAQKNIARYYEMMSGATPEERKRYETLIAANQRIVKTYGELQNVENSGLQTGQRRMNTTADKLTKSGQQDIKKAKRGAGALGGALVDIGVAGTQMLADATAGALTGGSALVPMFIRSFGGGVQEARQSDASLSQQLLYGVGSGAIEAGTEKISNVAAPFKKMFGRGLADTVVDKGIQKLSQKLSANAVGKALLTAGANAVGEGFEEFVGDILTPVLKRAVDVDNEAEFDLGDAMYDAMIGGALGIIGGSAELVRGISKSVETSKAKKADAKAENVVKMPNLEETAGINMGQQKTAAPVLGTVRRKENVQEPPFEEVVNHIRGSELPRAMQDELLRANALARNLSEKDARNYISGTVDEKTIMRGVSEAANMEPVAKVSGTEFAKGEKDLITQVTEYFNSVGGVAFNPQLGDVQLTRSGAKSDIAHGIGRKKAAAFAAVPQVIENGHVIDYQTNWKDRQYDTAVVAAPITIGEESYLAGVVLTRNQRENNFYIHEVLLTEKGTSPFKTGGRLNGDVPGGDVPSVISLLRKVWDVKENGSAKSDSRKSQGSSVDQLVEKIRSSTILPKHMQDELILANEQAGKLPKGTLERLNAAEGDGYLNALANDQNEPGDRMTQQDYARAAEKARLKNMKAPPESKREPVSQADLDELWQLWEDQANPVTDSTTRKEEALAEADNMIKTESTHQKQTLRDSAEEARSYFMRKMVDAGDSVSKVQKLAGDQYLYDYYNMARASASAGINMINGEQTDIAGMRVGESLNDIFDPIREKGKDYYSAFEKYLYHLHNIDRMSIVNGENTAKLEAEAALSEFDRENPDIATVTEARLQRKAEGLDQDAELARERLSLLRKVNQADRLGNKPVFGYEVTAEDSREISQRLLREHPEFMDYQKKVRGYIKNLMQYRVDSGLMTKADAEFLEKYYPNYVPTYRETEGRAYRTNEKSVKIGKTVGRAEGGNTELIPLHEALGRQSMQVVREGSKNRFGQRLLDDWNNHPQQAKKYISDVQKYDAGFSADTFDSLDVDPALQKNNTFFVYRDGKMMEMAVDPSLFDAVKALSPDKQETNKLVRGIMAGNKLFKELVTGYNPTFTVRNTVRDLQTAGLYSRDLTAFAKNYPLALKEIASEGPFWKQYKALGGSFSSIFDYQTGTVKESSKAVQKTLGRVEALNMTMEQAPRLAEFMSIVKKGDGSMENLMDAMHAAADVTVNFGRAGTLGKVLNANYVPFLNPGIQGFSRMVRRVTETKGAKEWAKLAVRAAAFGVAPAMLNALIYQDDKDWDDLRDSDKDTNYLFKIGDGMWLKLPKGRELSVLGMTGQRVGDMVKGKEVDWGDFIATVGNQVLPANPLVSNILFAAVSADLLDRKSPGKTWYGGNIESQRLQNYAPGQRYDSSTDIFSKWLGGKLNLSPKKINYILDQYSGVVGDFVLPLLTPQAERNAFAKAFTVDSVSSNRISSDFYNQGDEITYAKNDGDTSMQVVSRFWNKQVTACGKIYAKIRDIEDSPRLTDAEKREEVREAKAVLNGIQKNAMATLETYQSAVKRHLKGSSDDALDTAYREANRDCFGAEYALQVYNKETYKKARMANQNGVSYDDFYRYYFDTQDFASKNGKSADTQKMEYLESSNLKETTKAELFFADLASDSDLMKQAELEKSNHISPVQYWNYKMAISGLSADTDANGKTISGSKREKVLDAINDLNLTVSQKDALYYAQGYSAGTLMKAPWYDIEPKLDRMVQGSSRGGRKTTVATTPRLIPGTTLNQYGLDKYRLK